MPKWEYSTIGLDRDTTARASGRELWEERLPVSRLCHVEVVLEQVGGET